MTETEFWELIENSKLESQENISTQTSLLMEWLSGRSEGEIFDFDAHRRKFTNLAHTAELWCAVNLYMGYCSDDSFDYFKAWLVAQGKDAYTKSVEDPDSLLNIFPENAKIKGGEDFLCIPYEAYEKLTGKEDMEDYDDAYHSNVEIPNFPNIELDWIENEERMRSICPKVYDNFRRIPNSTYL